MDELHGDPTKIRNALNWKPNTTFKELVNIMVDADMKLAEKEKVLKSK